MQLVNHLLILFTQPVAGQQVVCFRIVWVGICSFVKILFTLDLRINFETVAEHAVVCVKKMAAAQLSKAVLDTAMCPARTKNKQMADHASVR